jgi:hypothetical protein
MLKIGDLVEFKDHWRPNRANSIGIIVDVKLPDKYTEGISTLDVYWPGIKVISIELELSLKKVKQDLKTIQKNNLRVGDAVLYKASPDKKSYISGIVWQVRVIDRKAFINWSTEIPALISHAQDFDKNGYPMNLFFNFSQFKVIKSNIISGSI